MSKMLKTDQVRELCAQYVPLFAAMGVTHHLDGRRKGERLDSDDTAFLVRQIEHVRTKILEVRHAALLARSFLPTAEDIPSWASFSIQIVYDDAGQAKVIANGADDLPAVDRIASEKALTIASLGASYGFSAHDLRQALGTGVPLQDLLAKTTRRVIDTAIDEMIATGALSSAGQSALGMVGFLTSSAVPSAVALTDGFLIPATTGDQMLADLNILLRAPRIATKQIFPATNVILSQKIFDAVSTKPRASGTDKSVLEAFKAQHPEVSVDVWHRLDLAGDGGTDDLAVAYCKDPEVIESIVPMEFLQHPPQFRNLKTVINCEARAGGVRIHHPKAIAYMSLSVATS